MRSEHISKIRRQQIGNIISDLRILQIILFFNLLLFWRRIESSVGKVQGVQNYSWKQSWGVLNGVLLVYIVCARALYKWLSIQIRLSKLVCAFLLIKYTTGRIVKMETRYLRENRFHKYTTGRIVEAWFRNRRASK